MANITIAVPNPDIPDVLAGLETRWRSDAVRLVPGYDALPDTQKVRACLAASVRAYTRNLRRDRAERGIVVPEPDVT